MPTSSVLLPRKHSARLRFSLIAGLAALLLPAAGQAQTLTFNPATTSQISIPDGSGSTTPAQYPTSSGCTNAACIYVSGLTGSYISMSITLTYSNVNTQSFADPALLLAAWQWERTP